MPVAEQAPSGEPEMSLIDEVLIDHDGDARAAIQTLLQDCEHLRRQLLVADHAVSRGLTRGWRPSFERDKECPDGRTA